MNVPQTVLRFIEDYRLVDSGDRVLVALSGGPDSVALLNILAALSGRLGCELAAVYVNHGIRKRAARKEERFCEKLCENLGVTIRVVREDIPARAASKKQGVEEAGREFRYALFEDMARSEDFDKVALGHHADDQVETVLFRLFRGTGPGGLTGMMPRRGLFIRPLLAISKSDLIGYLDDEEVAFCQDESNDSLAYRRNVIRHKVLSEVTKRINPQASSAVLSLVDHLTLDESYFEDIESRILRRIARYSPGGKLNLDLGTVRGYHRAIRRRLLRRCVIASWRSPLGPDRNVIDRLEDLIAGDSGRLSLPDGVCAEVAGSCLWLYREERHKVKALLKVGGKCRLDWPRVNMRAAVVASEAVDRRRNAAVVRVDLDRITGPLSVRLPRPGDRLKPLGMRGSKKLSDLFVDRKVPRPLREETLIVEDTEGIAWVVGVEIADRVKVTRASKRVLQLEYRVRKGVRFPAV